MIMIRLSIQFHLNNASCIYLPSQIRKLRKGDPSLWLPS